MEYRTRFIYNINNNSLKDILRGYSFLYKLEMNNMLTFENKQENKYFFDKR